ncbi:MAG: hypothetical protein IKB81_01105 [Paludibacteraceae bacterium]|nr:hypothetical protein [Paludibacteraceae bacterium]
MTQPIYTLSEPRHTENAETGTAYSTSGWNSLSVKRTTSFSTIHQEVIQTVSTSPGYTYKAYNPAEVPAQALYTVQPPSPRRNDRGPGTEATGEVPMGDMLLPLMLMAVGYLFLKLVRNRKKSQSL